MKKLLLMTCAAAAYAAHATPPEIGNVQFKQDENRLVTISYTLGGADAIVMMDVLTNGVSIGRALYSDATGDVNVKVKQGARQIFWQPRATWPDQKIRDESLSVKLTAWDPQTPYLQSIKDAVKALGGGTSANAANVARSAAESFTPGMSGTRNAKGTPLSRR